MLLRLGRRCRGLHDHQVLEGGRAKAAENYPEPLIRAILQGITDTCILSKAEPKRLRSTRGHSGRAFARALLHNDDLRNLAC